MRSVLLALFLVSPAIAYEPPSEDKMREMVQSYLQMQLERAAIEEYAHKLEKHIEQLQNATNCV